VNYKFLPSSDRPVLLYLKETKTPPSKVIPAPFVLDDLPGQVHIFPVIGNSKQLRNGFIEHGLTDISEETQMKIESDPQKLLKGLLLI
jgi:hypothetical protein